MIKADKKFRFLCALLGLGVVFLFNDCGQTDMPDVAAMASIAAANAANTEAPEITRASKIIDWDTDMFSVAPVNPGICFAP